MVQWFVSHHWGTGGGDDAVPTEGVFAADMMFGTMVQWQTEQAPTVGGHLDKH